jgi:tRNA threonylcarbamoyladenosine biosynthesis protein TsaE
LAKVPAMIILEGDLGAGKTTFIQNFIGEGETLSPTYSILSECKNFLHADLYRVEKNEELLQLEIQMYLEGKQYFFVEWGMKFVRRLFRELPENYSAYLIEIIVNESSPENSEGHSRNFSLYSLSDD